MKISVKFDGFYPIFEKKILKNTEKQCHSFGYILKHMLNNN
jgi:hypothetical protein